jgi:Zn-dependent protease
MLRSWRLGQAFGIDIFVHWTFLLVPTLILFSNLDQGLRIALLGAIVTVAVFGCVLLHELGHALMAKSYGIGTRDITLYPIGGVARLERMPEQPKAEIAIALAGPAVNVAIAGGLWLGMYLAGMVPDIATILYGSMAQAIVVNLLIANIGLVIFNMIPAFPMDGGRVLRSVLALFTSRLQATEVAASIGSLFAMLFVFAGIYFGHLTLTLVGMFVFLAGRQERAYVRQQEYQRQMRDWQGPTITVDADGSPSPAPPGFSGLVWEPQRQVWVVWRDGRPVNA